MRSKKCGISEPTLRRILSQKIKTDPQISTVLDILTYISRESSVRRIVEMYDGPLAKYISDNMLVLSEVDQDYSKKLNEELKNPIKYLVYKLSVNASGVSKEKVRNMFGEHGVGLLNELVEGNYAIKNEKDGRYYSCARGLQGSFENFVLHFKATADFIKPHKLNSRRPLNPFFINTSDSINKDTYEKILKMQRKHQRKISQLISDESSKGEIPFFYLAAIDTLDYESAFEIAEKATPVH